MHYTYAYIYICKYIHITSVCVHTLETLCIHTRDTLKNQLRWGSLVLALSFACTMQLRVLSHALFGLRFLAHFFRALSHTLLRARTHSCSTSFASAFSLARALSVSPSLAPARSLAPALPRSPSLTRVRSQPGAFVDSPSQP